ncbi:hypothetical protein G7B40_006225 [Aetokthonos hydrillicola Thurmond2011]|jgi:hypothetical protein|uniref:Uncharacterized protein n=1 Tax=Aetokthonos hydrillicola Thurmond2011 TaxID=2712845 RepID=A0AAP5M905_9CYAN|nr:hypothetical protein [Aetokthonos hydrillicola]MBW4585072.1 hypothetical protein [Aetokthonos hydrillicola CCALA 1050]MDR9894168.1 hypothetical protein [Aetokthonos hydrillicola Thurmond2011]
MNILDEITATFQEPNTILPRIFEEYIVWKPEGKQLILKQKMVLLLCRQAQYRVKQIINLELDPQEGFIATIEHNNIPIKLHFTPEKITLNEDSLEGELRLLQPPKFEPGPTIYSYLIAGLKTFLGGKIADKPLPKEVRVENDKVYYTLAQNPSKLLDALSHNLENGSALMIDMKQGELTIETSYALKQISQKKMRKWGQKVRKYIYNNYLRK